MQFRAGEEVANAAAGPELTPVGPREADVVVGAALAEPEVGEFEDGGADVGFEGGGRGVFGVGFECRGEFGAGMIGWVVAIAIHASAEAGEEGRGAGGCGEC